jgi:hypothetical protein
LVIGKKNLGDGSDPQMLAADEFARSTMRQEIQKLLDARKQVSSHPS